MQSLQCCCCCYRHQAGHHIEFPSCTFCGSMAQFAMGRTVMGDMSRKGNMALRPSRSRRLSRGARIANGAQARESQPIQPMPSAVPKSRLLPYTAMMRLPRPRQRCHLCTYKYVTGNNSLGQTGLLALLEDRGSTKICLRGCTLKQPYPYVTLLSALAPDRDGRSKQTG